MFFDPMQFLASKEGWTRGGGWSSSVKECHGSRDSTWNAKNVAPSQPMLMIVHLVQVKILQSYYQKISAKNYMMANFLIYFKLKVDEDKTHTMLLGISQIGRRRDLRMDVAIGSELSQAIEVNKLFGFQDHKILKWGEMIMTRKNTKKTLDWLLLADLQTSKQEHF